MGWFEDLSASEQSQRSGIRVAPETATEQYVNPALLSQFKGLEGLVGAGPGQSDVTAGSQAMRDYAAQLGQYSTAAGLFGAQQAGVDQYTKLGEMIFGGQMRQQQQEAQRLAGRLGRPVNDPILQAKLAQQRSDTVGSFAAQQAMQLPFQLAQFGGQRAEALQGLASQAMANRQALLGLGSQLREQDRAYRINTGERWSSQRQEGSFLGSLGGIAGIAGTVMGGIGMLGAGGIIGGGAKGAAGALGATGGLGDKMTGVLGVGGGAGGGGYSGAGALMGGMGSLLGGGAQAARALAPRTAPTNIGTNVFGGGGGLGFSGVSLNDPQMQQLMTGGGFPINYNYDYSPRPASADATLRSMSPSQRSMLYGRGY